MIPRIEFDPNAPAPLMDLRVIDLSRLVAGNMLSLQLADHGAEVIKIEDAQKGDPLRAWRVKGASLYWKVYGRNKKSLALNLRAAEGKKVVLDLASQSHVLIENFRPGTMEDMGLSPESLQARNPALVIVRVSGFGQDGPYRERPGFGSLIEGMSGFAAKNGFEDRPPVLPPLAMADMIAGLYGAYAVMIALRVAEQAGHAGLAMHYRGLLEAREPGLGSAPSPRLRLILDHAAMVAATPGKATCADITRLEAAGLSARDIVALSQLIAFVSYQVRAAFGLALLKESMA